MRPPRITATSDNDEHNNVHHRLFSHLLPSGSSYALNGPLLGICYITSGCIHFSFVIANGSPFLVFCYRFLIVENEPRNKILCCLCFC